MMRKIILAAALFVTCSISQAQVTGPKPTTVAPGSQISAAEALDAMLSAFENDATLGAKAMPAEKYNFTPASLKIPGAKYDGVMTFAQEVKHLADANYFIYGYASGLKSEDDRKALKALTSKEDILAALAKSFLFAHKAIATLTPDNALEVVKGEGLQTRATAMAFGVAHGFDHYGQMVEYMRMNGVIPTGSK